MGRRITGHEQCARKRRFTTELSAVICLANVQRLHPDSAPVRVYRCPCCNGWHMTSKPLRHNG